MSLAYGVILVQILGTAERSDSLAAVEPADHGGVAVIKEKGCSCVQGSDPGDVVVGEREIEHLKVLFHALTTH
jgi:hypothetical protein